MAAGIKSYESFSFEGAMSYGPEVDDGALPAYLAGLMKEQFASQVDHDARRVEFGFRLLTFYVGSSFNPICRFGFGELTVDRDKHLIHYRLNAKQLFVLTSGLIAFMATFVTVASIVKGEILWPLLLLLPVGWLWLTVPNVLLAMPLFRRFLRNALAAAPRKNACAARAVDCR